MPAAAIQARRLGATHGDGATHPAAFNISAVSRGSLPGCAVPRVRRIPFRVSLTTACCMLAGVGRPAAWCAFGDGGQLAPRGWRGRPRARSGKGPPSRAWPGARPGRGCRTRTSKCRQSERQARRLFWALAASMKPRACSARRSRRATSLPWSSETARSVDPLLICRRSSTQNQQLTPVCSM